MAKVVLGITLYNIREVGQLLGVQPSTVSKYIREGLMTAQVIGGCRYISEESIKQFVTGK